MFYSEDSTDNEQEDLPYDGDLQNRYQHSYEPKNLEGFFSVENAIQNVTPSRMSSHTKGKFDYKTELSQRKINQSLLPPQNDQKFTATIENELPSWKFNNSGRNEDSSNSKMSDVLLRHFPKENLTSSCQLIDSETIPEISFNDSFDETVLSKSKISENAGIFSPEEETKNNMGRQINCDSVVRNRDSIQNKPFSIADCANPIYNSSHHKEDNLQFNQKEREINGDVQYNSISKEKFQKKKSFLENTESFHVPKHGQHQDLNRFPDLSEVIPKVTAPEGNNSSHIFKRIKSYPNLLGKSPVVNDLLEPINVSKKISAKNQEEEMVTSKFDQQLEILTRQAEVQNRIDHLRFNSKMLPCSNSHRPDLSIKAHHTGISSKIFTFSPVTIPVEPMLGFPQTLLSELQATKIASSFLSADVARQSSVNPLLQNITDNEEQMLKEQTEELKAKVATFSKSVKQDTFSVQEHLQFLQLLKDQLDQLEWNYLATKKKHYALQLQNHQHLSTYIGEFDPHRKVEGEIFKLGTLLEAIKEQIDKTFSPDSTVYVTSPSFISYESGSPSCSSYSESPLITSVSESPKKNIAVNFPKNEKCRKNRNHSVEVISQRTYKIPNLGEKNHPFRQNPLELQKRKSCEQIVASVDRSRLLTNEQSVPVEEFEQGNRSLKKPQNYNREQENTDGNSNDWKIRSSSLGNPANQESNMASLTVLKEQGNLAYPSNHYFLEKMRNFTNEQNIITYSRRKIQSSRNQMCSCSSGRNQKVECSKANRGNSDCERCSGILEEKTVDLNVSATGSGSSQKYTIVHQRICNDKEPEYFIDKLCDRQNQNIPQTYDSRKHDTNIGLSQNFSGWNTSGRQSIKNLRNRHTEDKNTMILNSTLDHIIQTANNLKKTTEHMMQAVSEDLAKVKIQTFSSGSDGVF